jgi:hypothetical protein
MAATAKNVSVVTSAKAGSAAPPGSALPILEVVTAVTGWLTTVSTERTRREQIWAQRDAALAVVRARHSLAELAITSVMGERARVLDGLLAVVGSAIEAQDVTTAATALQQVGGLAQKPPYSDVAALLNAMDAPDTAIVL